MHVLTRTYTLKHYILVFLMYITSSPAVLKDNAEICFGINEKQEIPDSLNTFKKELFLEHNIVNKL